MQVLLILPLQKVYIYTITAYRQEEKYKDTIIQLYVYEHIDSLVFMYLLHANVRLIT